MPPIARLLAAAAGLLLAACAAAPERPAPELGGGALPAVAAAIAAPAPSDWRPWFRDVSRGAILIDTDARRLTYWSPGGETRRHYPVAVGRGPEFERRGLTQVVRKRTDPDWTPTPSMRRRDPSLPAHVPPGPDNPMGQHALYLGWTYYAIHGTNDPLSVGRAASSGCFRLFPEDIETLYREVGTGTPVLVR